MSSFPMTPLDVRPDMERAPWTNVRNPLHGQLTSIGLLRHGTSGGNASVALLVTLDDGRHVVAQTTWRLLRTAVRALASSPVAAEEDDTEQPGDAERAGQALAAAARMLDPDLVALTRIKGLYEACASPNAAPVGGDWLLRELGRALRGEAPIPPEGLTP